MNTVKIIFLFIFLLSVSTIFAQNSNHPKVNFSIGYKLPDSVLTNCGKSEAIEKIIGDAISLGAPLYNQGLHVACYRVYEWASYKILYEYGKACKTVEAILKKAVEKSHGDYSDTEKAWMIRQAFDKVLGVPTETNNQSEKEKENLLRKG